MSLDGLSDPHEQTGIGEVYGAPRTFAPDPPVRIWTDHICGTAEEHRIGEVLDPSRPPTKYLPLSGLPTCCAPLRREVVFKMGLGVALDVFDETLDKPHLLTVHLQDGGSTLVLTFAGPVTYIGPPPVIGINGFNTTGTFVGEGPTGHTQIFSLSPAVPHNVNITVTIPESTFTLDAVPGPGNGNLFIPGFPVTRAVELESAIITADRTKLKTTWCCPVNFVGPAPTLTGSDPPTLTLDSGSGSPVVFFLLSQPVIVPRVFLFHVVAGAFVRVTDGLANAAIADVFVQYE